MKVKNIGSNMTEIEVGDYTILVSYQTPVACFISGRGYVRTSQKFSVTTSRHINKWLDGAACEIESQEYFNNLLAVKE